MIQCRNELIKTCRRLDALGYVPATDGNISVRLNANRLLVTPSLAVKGALQPAQLLITDLDGQVVRGKGQPSSEIKMHLYVYRMRPDVVAVVHAHPPTACGFAAAGLALDQPVLPEVVLTVGPVPLARYATPSTDEVPQSLEPFIKEHNAVLLTNHGVLTLGADLDEALHRMERVEHLAKVILIARLLGRPGILSKEEIDRLMAAAKLT